ncbi:hypothetical protein RFI_06805 [Reticulomyxa filosa]|uniref:Phospholipase/carboxylesterase/thioesterase domain-containing protein n=1 Tax=Reticulomyxa filosa TaxID=46433 RepID=X6NWV8_RETFI|nr:hypothetical protein RFI_06805 [Reticulomyxa filosa]|eukprot:ETO30314.1 hypothetical protein RFI_06805 [Reticulomyxa filosa]
MYIFTYLRYFVSFASIDPQIDVYIYIYVYVNKLYVNVTKGGAISIFMALMNEEHLFGGVISLSGYLCDQPPAFLTKFEKLSTELKIKKQKHLPILMCHGQKDMVVPIAYGLHPNFFSLFFFLFKQKS